MHQVGDRIKESTTKNGSGTLYAISGAVSGFQSFADGVGVGNETFFVVSDGTSWECCFGQVTSASLLTRLTVEDSSNAGAAVVWGAGSKVIVACQTARSIAIPGVAWNRVPRVADLGAAAFCSVEQIPVNLHPQDVVAGYVILADDRGSALFVTGSSTIYLPSAATVSPGWSVPVRNYGLGNVFVAAASGETIDDTTQALVLPGTTRWVIRYSATSFRTL